MGQQTLVGAALMALGTLLFLPGAAPNAGSLSSLGLVVAAVLLTCGTYLVGTGEDGRPV